MLYKKINAVIGYFMSVVYLLFGTFILVYSDKVNLPATPKLIFALAIFLYGIFRFYRTFKMSRENEEDN